MKIASAATTANVAKTASAIALIAASINKMSAKVEDRDAGEHNPPSHLKELSRLNRIVGQVEGIKKMIEGNRYCPDILIQLRAVRSALRAVESNILATHLQHCVAQSFGDKDERDKKIAELKNLFDRFES